MMRTTSPKTFFLLAHIVAAVLGGTSTAPAAADQVSQAWPELDVYYRLDASTRLYFLLAPIREVYNGKISNLDDPELGANIELGVFPIVRGQKDAVGYDDHRMTYLRFRTGIRYLATTGDGDHSEWRIVAELTPRAKIPYDIQLAIRNRVDFRWVDEMYSWRYRPRLWIEREFKAGPEISVVPYGSAEVFWDSRDDAWTRSLYQVGAVLSVSPWFAPEAYWAHQIDEDPEGETIVDALGLVLTFYF